MRRRIAQLDEAHRLERARLEEQRRLDEERQRAQEEFEQQVRERTERQIQQHREQEARAEEAQALQEEEVQRALQERERRRREQQLQEERRSRDLEQQRMEGRSRLQAFEEELERQWAQDEAQERRRIDEYARYRQHQFEEWERQLTAERQRFASAAKSCADARRHERMASTARADERFYGAQRMTSSRWSPTEGMRQPSPRPPNTGGSGAAAALGPLALDLKGLPSEEQGALKELHTVRGAPKEVQKAKVKDLLLQWHPDKNPDCVEKATRVFQFVQHQRQAVLGL